MNLETTSTSPRLLSEPPLSPGAPAPAPVASTVPPPEPQPGTVLRGPEPLPAPVHVTSPPAAAVAPAPAEEKPALPIEAQLVRMGLMTLDQLADANRERLETGKSVADIAVERGWVSAQDLARLSGAVAPAAPVTPATPEPAPAHEPVSEAEPVPQPVATVSRVEEVAPPAPAPVPGSAPAASPVAPAPHEQARPAAEATTFRVSLHLLGGERVEVAALPDEDTAKTRAREIVFDLTRPRADEWPFYAGRFLRPDTILSVDILTE